jgi:hypothetical protein
MNPPGAIPWIVTDLLDGGRRHEELFCEEDRTMKRR